jgi:hypothetical protein
MEANEQFLTVNLSPTKTEPVAGVPFICGPPSQMFCVCCVLCVSQRNAIHLGGESERG